MNDITQAAIALVAARDARDRDAYEVAYQRLAAAVHRARFTQPEVAALAERARLEREAEEEPVTISIECLNRLQQELFRLTGLPRGPFFQMPPAEIRPMTDEEWRAFAQSDLGGYSTTEHMAYPEPSPAQLRRLADGSPYFGSMEPPAPSIDGCLVVPLRPCPHCGAGEVHQTPQPDAPVRFRCDGCGREWSPR